MKFTSPLIEAVFKERPNRFLGIVDFEGTRTQCFIPNPGRMKELLISGTKVYIQRKEGKNRKTKYDIVLVDLHGTLVSVDSRIPNKLVGEAIDEGLILEFDGYRVAKSEHTVEDSRLDFLLEGEEGKLFLEVKSCTLVKGNTAYFPDAPTKRGSRHLNTLSRCLEKGRAAAFVVIQRSDATFFRPYAENDPVFAETLKSVQELGVEVIVYNCKVSTQGIWIHRKVRAQIHENINKEHKNTSQI